MKLITHAAEFVLPGHPDKLCDAVADALVQAALEQESRALVGVEVAAHRSHLYITGRIGCKDATSIDVEAIARSVYRDAGYTPGWIPQAEHLQVVTNLCLGPLEDGEDTFRELSDDQAICIGYANDLEVCNHSPPEQWLVQRLARAINQLRSQHPELGLGPDGKVMIVMSESIKEDSPRLQLEAMNVSLQQPEQNDAIALHRAIRLVTERVLEEAASSLSSLSARLPDQLTVNGAGTFEVGGPEGDNGLSGKKLVMDAYGPRVPIGGGAWSGKDFFKADRAGGLHARRLAKALVWLGLAPEVYVTLGWFPGDREARVLQITDHLKRPLAAARVASWIDLSLKRSGEQFRSNGSLVELARWGHFSDAQLPWESFERL